MYQLVYHANNGVVSTMVVVFDCTDIRDLHNGQHGEWTNQPVRQLKIEIIIIIRNNLLFEQIMYNYITNGVIQTQESLKHQLNACIIKTTHLTLPHPPILLCHTHPSYSATPLYCSYALYNMQRWRVWWRVWSIWAWLTSVFCTMITLASTSCYNTILLLSLNRNLYMYIILITVYINMYY